MAGAAPAPQAASAKEPPAEEDEVDPGEVAGLRILHYPHPALRAANAPVGEDEFGTDGLRELCEKMFALMYAANGVGLAAPQVGINKRLMVVNPTGDRGQPEKEAVLLNPVISAASPHMVPGPDGCLSLPGLRSETLRHEWVEVAATDIRGARVGMTYRLWQARVFQHEMDHLEAGLYIDRVGEAELAKLQPALDELERAFGPGGCPGTRTPPPSPGSRL
eukprot:TRINITY_DN7511_c0_g2_i3.p2 TRINITY_DN7511_c0_g2~~TRINITY_DN7511_c0_g2_i3.p2  ORF type:complete len:242 (+),score=61.34 TRINITY_DN7511_c0_g2_i3:69-728(+)